MIVGNKSDLNNVVDLQKEDFENTLDTQKKVSIFEVSAKENKNVDQAFQSFIKKLMLQKDEKRKERKIGGSSKMSGSNMEPINVIKEEADEDKEASKEDIYDLHAQLAQ